MTVGGRPIDKVEELDARLSEHLIGGAQIWRLAGEGETTAVGVAYPERTNEVEACRRIVAEWRRDHGLN